MSIGAHLISITCPISSNSLINFTCRTSTTPIIPFKNHVTHTWRSIIYIYIHLNIQAYPSNYHSSKGNKATKPHSVSPSPSLRRDNLAQTSPPPPKRGSKQETGTTAGSRLGETLLTWASGSLAQNNEQVAWATFREIGLGEPPPDSPG